MYIIETINQEIQNMTNNPYHNRDLIISEFDGTTERLLDQLISNAKAELAIAEKKLSSFRSNANNIGNLQPKGLNDSALEFSNEDKITITQMTEEVVQLQEVLKSLEDRKLKIKKSNSERLQ